jgi:hypothetical protein
MELFVPTSLINAMNKKSAVEITLNNFTTQLPSVLKFMSEYQAIHNVLPVEWQNFCNDLGSVFSSLTISSKEEFMKTTSTVSNEVKRLQWTLALVKEGWTEAELINMDMVELRDLYEEEFPSTITSYSATATGGVSKKVTHIKKQA